MTTEASARDGLDSYFKNAWKFPVLEKEDEQMLAIRWRDHADPKAIETLITSHLRLVAKMAMKYRSYGLPIADLISEGNIGLIKSVQKFDPDRGFRLSTYAMWWIKAAIIDYILKSWSMVKVGSVVNQKKLFFTLRRAKARLNIIDDMELSPEQALLLSKATNVSADDIVQINRRLSFRDSSLNAPLSSEKGAGELQELLVDERESQEVVLGDREEKQQQIKRPFKLG